MTTLEIKTILGIDPAKPDNRINANALRTLVSGGSELLDAKEWANDLIFRSRDPGKRGVAHDALEKLLMIERAMLAGIEKGKGLPDGTLTDRMKSSHASRINTTDSKGLPQPSPNR